MKNKRIIGSKKTLWLRILPIALTFGFVTDRVAAADRPERGDGMKTETATFALG